MAGLSNDEQESTSLERILREATLLFAAHGYHGVSTRMLADAVDLNVSPVHYHTGSKKELYRKAFSRLFARAFALVSPSPRSALACPTTTPTHPTKRSTCLRRTGGGRR